MSSAVETLDKQLHSQQGTERTARPHPPDEIESSTDTTEGSAHRPTPEDSLTTESITTNEVISETAATAQKPRRKRRRDEEEKQQHLKEKYILLDGFVETCQRGCSSKLTEEQRRAINTAYWELTFPERRLWLDSHILVEDVSHYNLNNAPNRRYLDPHLTITDMWKHYNDIHPERKISYIAYQRIFTKEKISFGKPSQDDCDLCAKYKSHCEENSSSDHDSLSCEMCQLGKVHEADASEARDNYTRDRC
ncbi:hypothetical protein RRG08_003137 [Elysia crispata]|uniref:Uncharacterized protein n=1 Tax=Elysia crispata TaxID=231223 RepID=A0AAE1EBC2_9GAST|nr:hypothetical protein RRG08_003137 [Elysia crispata]